MDPFEKKVLKLMAKKIMEASKLISTGFNNNNDSDDETETENETEKESKNEGKNITETKLNNEPLPYNISKHVQYMKQEEYMRKRKALKKQSDIV